MGRISGLLLLLSLSQAQILNVTFHYVPQPDDNFVRVFVPGTMNNWGPNSNGFISPSAPSLMSYADSLDAYVKTYTFSLGETVYYKFHFHYNSSGSDWAWISDPANPIDDGEPYHNSVLQITDPLFFEPNRHLNRDGFVVGLSIGIFSSDTVEHITYILGADTLDGTDSLRSNGIFYVSFPPRSILEEYRIMATINGVDSTIFYQPALEVQELPLPDNVALGPNISGNNLTLVLRAPGQPIVQVLCTEPGVAGTAADAVVMNKATGEPDLWWVTLSNLTPGEKEVEYLFLDGTRISDPFSRRLRDGRTIVEIGPGGVSTADDFSWGDSLYVRPAEDTLVIYELHIDDFAAQGYGQGRLQDIEDHLDYFHELGINAIELMPITEVPGTHSWGYDPEHCLAIESNYGTPEEFKHLVNAAHQYGIAIILDLVWNHTRSTNPLWEMNPDLATNPYFKAENDLRPHEDQGSWGMLDFDHFTPETQEYVREIHRIWVQDFHVDGFRFDFTRGIGWSLPDQGLLGWSSALWDLDSTVYQIAEHLPADPGLINFSTLHAGWNDSFHDRLKEEIFPPYGQYNSLYTIRQQILKLHEYTNTGNTYASRIKTVKASVTHDEQSLIMEMAEFANVPLNTALQRDKLYSTVLFTAMGIPMIWQAQELGMQSGWTDTDQDGNWDEHKLSYRPVDWSLLDQTRGQEHLALYQTLIQLRKKNQALYRGTFSDLWRYDNARTIVYGYSDEAEGNQGDQVVVIANFSGQEQTLTNVPFLSAGTWYNVFFPGDNLSLATSQADTLVVPAYTALVFTNRNWTQLTTAPSPTELPQIFSVSPGYPNPFNPEVEFKVTLPGPGELRVSVYDIQGKQVRTLTTKIQSAGDYSVTWNGKNDRGLELPSGIYLVRFQQNSRIHHQKITLLR